MSKYTIQLEPTQDTALIAYIQAVKDSLAATSVSQALRFIVKRQMTEHPLSVPVRGPDWDKKVATSYGLYEKYTYVTPAMLTRQHVAASYLEGYLICDELVTSGRIPADAVMECVNQQTGQTIGVQRPADEM